MSARIAIVLPRKEAFALDRFGAISLVVEAYVRHSAYRPVTRVLGAPVPEPRDATMFGATMAKDRWWRRRNRGFALGAADYLAAAPPRHIDVHNRVETFWLLAKRFPGAAVSMWFHNDPQGMRGARTARERQRILDRAHLVICVSDWVRDRFLDGVPNDGVADHVGRVVVFPASFDTVSVTPAAKENLILFVGRIIEEKGVLPLAQALAGALPDLPAWRATLIGAGPKAGTDYFRRVVKTVAPLGDRVTMPGFLNHEAAMQAFARAAIAVVPSQWPEPCALAVREAMASGCATIASARGGTPQIIGDAGILVEPPDAAGLATALRRLAGDDQLRENLQWKGRIRAIEALDVRPWAARLDAMRRTIDADLN
jgi:UDP-glucose:(glucosyl)LPS alpha-1,2-glucosyltransferase